MNSFSWKILSIQNKTSFRHYNKKKTCISEGLIILYGNALAPVLELPFNQFEGKIHLV